VGGGGFSPAIYFFPQLTEFAGLKPRLPGIGRGTEVPPTHISPAPPMDVSDYPLHQVSTP